MRTEKRAEINIPPGQKKASVEFFMSVQTAV